MSSTTNGGTKEFTIQGPVIHGTKLYLNEDFADFHFICKSSCGQDERIPAHKLLLINTSEVFRVMFNESWEEKAEVDIVDASAAAFREFLQFFYLGTIKLTMENIAEVMNLENKYDVAECYDCCAEYLMECLTNDDVCWGYELAVHLEHKGLEKFCEIMMAINTKAVLSSESFLQAELLEALMKWIKQKRTQEKQQISPDRYGELAHEIRFGLLKIEEVAKVDSLYGTVFEVEEFREIIQMMASEEFQPKRFCYNRKERSQPFQWDECDVIECDRKYDYFYYETKPYYLKNMETTDFKINQTVLLRSFTCSDLSEYDADNEEYALLDDWLSTIFKIIQINGADDEVVLYDGKAELNTEETTLILLECPILIRSGFKYEIRMQQTVPENCCTHSILKSVVDIKPDIKVQFDGAKNTVTRGIIERMELIRV